MIDLLSTYCNDRYLNTPLGNLGYEDILWCTTEQLPSINTLSSTNWRIFCMRTIPKQSIQLKQVCYLKGKYIVVSNSSLSILGFEPTTLCCAVPPGIAPKLLITSWNDIQITGCGVIISSANISASKENMANFSSRFSVSNQTNHNPEEKFDQLPAPENLCGGAGADRKEDPVDHNNSHPTTAILHEVDNCVMEDDAFSFFDNASIES